MLTTAAVFLTLCITVFAVHVILGMVRDYAPKRNAARRVMQ